MCMELGIPREGGEKKNETEMRTKRESEERKKGKRGHTIRDETIQRLKLRQPTLGWIQTAVMLVLRATLAYSHRRSHIPLAYQDEKI